jgi:hypothetical protein
MNDWRTFSRLGPIEIGLLGAAAGAGLLIAVAVVGYWVTR